MYYLLFFAGILPINHKPQRRMEDRLRFMPEICEFIPRPKVPEIRQILQPSPPLLRTALFLSHFCLARLRPDLGHFIKWLSPREDNSLAISDQIYCIKPWLN